MLSTLLSDLSQEHARCEASVNAVEDRREQDKLARNLWRQYAEHQHAAERAFGELNGWTLASKQFSPRQIGHAHCDYDLRPITWMDHPLFYRDRVPGRRLGRNIAIVGQPYGPLDHYRSELDALADQYGLRWYVPPAERASIWNPGSTLFIVLTMPRVEPRWLPEQCGGGNAA